MNKKNRMRRKNSKEINNQLQNVLNTFDFFITLVWLATMWENLVFNPLFAAFFVFNVFERGLQRKVVPVCRYRKQDKEIQNFS